MTRRTIVALALVAALGPLLFAGPAGAQWPGVTPTEIKIGNTNPYSGPASAYGTIGKALAAYFKKVNDEGGINGRKINFVTLDDGYSPPKTVEMVRRLVEQDQVAFVFQTLGTPTNSAIHKYLNEQKVPHLFVATGATKWGDPRNFPWTMGWQPTYQTEGHIYAQYVLKNVPNPKIGILYQNDDYGKDYVKGLKDGLGEAGRKLIVLEQSYEVTDPTIDSQIVNLKNSGANVFYNVTIPKFAVQAIKKSHDIGWKPLHLLNNVSASVDVVLKPAGLEASRDLITALYLKDPTAAAAPAGHQSQHGSDGLLPDRAGAAREVRRGALGALRRGPRRRQEVVCSASPGVRRRGGGATTRHAPARLVAAGLHPDARRPSAT